MRYSCIDRRRNRYPIRLLCRSLKVSPSGYYAWRGRPESRRARRDRQLTQLIRAAHAASDGTYGSPRIHAELKEDGFACGLAKVARLMRKTGLKGCPKRRFRVTTKAGLTRARNLLDQDFSAETVNERWASDITYIWTGQGWLYLAVVMDLYSRRIIGWSMVVVIMSVVEYELILSITRSGVITADFQALLISAAGYGVGYTSWSGRSAESDWAQEHGSF